MKDSLREHIGSPDPRIHYTKASDNITPYIIVLGGVPGHSWYVRRWVWGEGLVFECQCGRKYADKEWLMEHIAGATLAPCEVAA